MAADRPRRVFLDANVVIRAGKPPGGPLIPRVADLVDAGYIKVVTTDLTKIEIAKNHGANDFEVIGDLTRRRVATWLMRFSPLNSRRFLRLNCSKD